MKLEEIQQRLEADSKFQYYRDAVGLTVDDFEITDVKTNTVLQLGKKDIGNFYILVLEDNSLSAFFDVNAKGMRKTRLSMVGVA